MKPELLAPAGNLEKLKWAAVYGADAVYFGSKFGSLRSFAGNLSFDQAADGIEFLHARGKKGFVTLNIYPFSDEFEQIRETAGTLDEIGVDAFIVADLGVLFELKKLGVKAPIHISTQANTINSQSALAYKKLGAKRVNLARELSVEQIKDIQKDIGGQMETEVFIHGAVCFSYSGRCAISDYTTGYRANRGECKHPCRWKYSLVEEMRPGQYIPVYEDERGLYLFNTKDIAGFEYVPELVEAGVSSFKIEGRMKSVHYIASIVSFYRQVLDGKKFSQQEAFDILKRVSNRGYSAGFLKGEFGPSDYDFEKSDVKSNSRFVGDVTTYKGQKVIHTRNKIFAGETLEILTPDGQLKNITLPDPLISSSDQVLQEVNNPTLIKLDDNNLPEFTILRRLGDSATGLAD